MATTRLREKSHRKRHRDNIDTSDNVRTLRSSIKDEDRKIKEESPPQMSLDVLAQVASATLQKQDQAKKGSPKKVSKRNITSMEVLNLDQIQGLSDKALINLFADLSANEMSRNYTYACFLMPEKCHKEFTSFGNEQKARMQMRTHLLGHIERLIDDANDPEMSQKFNFTATPVHVIKRRELELTSKKKRSGGEPCNKQKKGVLQKSPSFTALKPSKTGNSQVSNEQETVKVKAEPPDRDSESFSEIQDYSKSDDEPYPPMPKSSVGHGRIPITEEAASNSDNDDDDDSINKKARRSALTQTDYGGLKHSPPEWERRLALRYIRELKGKKKDDKVPLMCRICKDKTFTACATLIYHYRSHAGIKPFVCLICHTTFTRQHSLNYHMLIHNNQSRFTCKDCGRKFRHPSHFKEHLRRHTGETPFVCSDCPQKFKTRNTYKRHLKTRHGKLLTAAGIHLLSVEEWAKVRTKPYRKVDEERREEMPEPLPQPLPGFQTLLPILKIEEDSEESSEAESVSEHSIKTENYTEIDQIMPSLEAGQTTLTSVENGQNILSSVEQGQTTLDSVNEQDIMSSDQQSYFVPIQIVVNT